MLIFRSLLVRTDASEFDKFCQAVDKKDKKTAERHLKACLDILKTKSNMRFWSHSGDKEQVNHDMSILKTAETYYNRYVRL